MGTALCWGCVPEAGLVELATLAARHGFPEISVRPAQYFRARRESGWREQLAGTGVSIGVVDGLVGYLPGSDGAAADAERHASLDGCLEATVDLGARTLNVAHYLGDPAVEEAVMAAEVREIADRAAQAGTRISMEFLPGTALPDLATALRIVERAGSPAAGVLFDTWHHLRGGGTGADLAGLEPGQILEAQISGRRTPAPGEVYAPMTGRLAPGDGDAPVAELVRALRAAEPDLVLGLEVFTAERGEMDRRVAHLAAATRKFLGE
ncbi:sugar phosphate isomerase/epimerase family protein [Tomitella biformata]|uniref:sugar phosphate isomerase/epimerase family protein n=1 Tax=Tomitella biformata TaxID=630403 RepID=UPI00130E98C7|nr:sugar phosphate isomerase/epimerase [Tomitella biformata]